MFFNKTILSYFLNPNKCYKFPILLKIPFTALQKKVYEYFYIYICNLFFKL